MGLLAFLGLRASRNRKASAKESLPLALFPFGEYNAPVALWANSIQALGQSHAYCRLRKLVQCKETTGSQHEFLLVFIRHPSNKEAIVLVDRKELEASPSSTSLRPVLDKHGLATTTVIRDAVRVSYDGTTHCLTRHFSDYAEIHTLKFPQASQAPSVAHLAALLTTLSRHSLSQSPHFEMQCSWFVYTAVEVLNEIFEGEGKTSKKWVRVPYGGMRVGTRDTVASLILEYTSAWEDFSRGLGLKGKQLRLRSKKHHTKQREEKKAKRQEEMDSFADMLRTMGS